MKQTNELNMPTRIKLSMFSFFYYIYDMFEYIGIKLEPVYMGHLSITVLLSGPLSGRYRQV